MEVNEVVVRTGLISHAGTKIQVVELQCASKQNVYVLRMWPGGQVQKMVDWTLLLTYGSEQNRWVGKTVNRLERCYALVWMLMRDYVDIPTVEGVTLLMQAVDGFNETESKAVAGAA